MTTKGGYLRKALLAIFLALGLAGAAYAQQPNTLNLTAQSSDCSTANSCNVVLLGPNIGGVTFTADGTWSGTVQIEATGNNNKWVALSATPSNSTTTVTSFTGTGTWQANVAGYTQVRLRVSTYSSGTIITTITPSTASARGGNGGGGGGGGTPGGTPTQIQFNDTGAFGGVAGSAVNLTNVDGIVGDSSSVDFTAQTMPFVYNFSGHALGDAGTNGFGFWVSPTGGSLWYQFPQFESIGFDANPIFAGGSCSAAPYGTLFISGGTGKAKFEGGFSDGAGNCIINGHDMGTDAASYYDYNNIGGNGICFKLGAGGTHTAQFTSGCGNNVAWREVDLGRINVLGVTAVGSPSVIIDLPTSPGTGYNFNLPSSGPGTSGQYLISGGGGSTPMSWTSAFSGTTATLSASGAASVPALSMTGTPFAGTGTTSTPLFYMNGGTAPTSWATAGTYLGVNAASGFTGNFLDLHLNGGASLASINSVGTISGAALNSTGNITAGAGNLIGWTGRSIFSSPADGQIRLTNAAATDFTRLEFGGTTSSFPALKRNSTALNVRLADDSADAPLTSGPLTINGGTQIQKVLSATATLDFGSLVSIGCEDLTITVTGAAVGDTVALGVPNGSVPSATFWFTGWVSTTNTVTVRGCTLVSGDPASGTFRATVMQF